MYNVIDISKYVINYCNNKGYEISNLKLQKMLYLIQAFFLINSKNQCFIERIEAWDFGPVVPEVYRMFKQFGGGNIPPLSLSKNKVTAKKIPLFYVKKKKTDCVISKDDQDKINIVIDKYAKYSATDLVDLTHHQKPWKDAYNKGRNTEIEIEAIKDYFYGK